MEGAEKYHRSIDTQGQSSVAQLLRWIRPGSKVLEMGPATGMMTRLLSSEKGCEVTCVEVDPRAAEQAASSCAQMIVGDLNRTEWSKDLQPESYDYLIYADVLEHLLDPQSSLQFALKFLKPDGEVLISVPNIGYVGVIAELLEGRFDYRRDGLLDETHVHFFTRRSLVQLLGKVGLLSLEWSRTTIAPEFSEFTLQTNSLGANARAVLAAVPDGDTYQFLVRASRSGVAVLPSVPQTQVSTFRSLRSQIFFDMGDGFSEERSTMVSLDCLQETQRVRIRCPRGIRSLRVDPIDAEFPIQLHRMRIASEEQLFFEWTPEHGAISSLVGILHAHEIFFGGTSVLVPSTEDPAIVYAHALDEEVELLFEFSLAGARAVTHIGENISDLLSENQLRLAQIRDLESYQTTLSEHLTNATARIEELDDVRRSLEETVTDLKVSLSHTWQEFLNVRGVLEGVVASSSWRITRPLRVLGRVLRATKNRLLLWKRASLREVYSLFPGFGRWQIGQRLWRRELLGSDYQLRCVISEPSQSALGCMQRAALKSSAGPLISVLMPTYRTNPKWLREAIESVKNQTYPRWELCIADDASNDPAVRSILSTYAANDPRIKVTFLKENGHISKASNAALELVSGEYVVLLDHDDILALHALQRLTDTIEVDPSVDVLYSDEDKLSLAGERYEPTCKPDWSPDYFLSLMYTGHISCFRTELIRGIGGFREGFEGSQDYDLMLRVTERTDRVTHIPEVLYHWRVHEESVAGNLDSKPYAFVAAKKALAEALVRRGFPAAQVNDSRARGLYLVERGKAAPLVGVVICSDKVPSLKVHGVSSDTFGRADEQKAIKRLRSYSTRPGGMIAVVAGAEVSEGSIKRILDHGSESSIGIVSPLFLDPEGRVLAAGMSLVGDEARANFAGLSPEDLGYRGRLAIPFNVSLVSPHVVVFKQELLADVPDTISTIPELIASLCFSARRKGMRCVIDPSVGASVSDTQVSGGFSEGQIAGVLKLYGLQGFKDPYLPAGLPVYEGHTEMPVA